MKFSNFADNPVNFEIIMPGFKSAEGQVLDKSGTLQPYSSETLKIPIQDYVYQELPILEGLNDLKNYSYQAKQGFFIIGKCSAQGGSVAVRFVSEVSSDEITLNEITGKLKRTEIKLRSQYYETHFGNDIKDLSSRLNFEEASFTLEYFMLW